MTSLEGHIDRRYTGPEDRISNGSQDMAGSLTWKLVQGHLVAINLNQGARLVGQTGALAHGVEWTGVEDVLLL